MPSVCGGRIGRLGLLVNRSRLLMETILRVAFASGSKFVGVGLAFCMSLVFARQMDPVEFGLYSIGFSLAGLLWPFVALGQPISAMRFWPTLAERYGVPTANFVIVRGTKMVALGSTVLAISGVALFLLKPNSSGLFSQPEFLIWVGLFGLTLAFSQFLTFALRAQGNLGWSLVPRDVIWRVLAIAAALHLGQMSGLTGLIVATIALVIITAAQLWRVFGLRVTGGVRFSIQRPNENELTEIRRAQWGLMGVDVARQWIQQSSTVVVALFLGPLAAGGFFAAQRLANLLSLTLVGTNQVSGPAIAKDWHAGRVSDVQRLVTAMVSIATLSSLFGLAFFIVLGSWLLSWFDAGFSGFYWSLITLCVGQVVSSACGPNGHLLNLAGMERTLFVVTMISGVIGLASTIVGAASGGVLGAAIGTTFGVVLWNVWVTWLCSSRLGILPIHPAHLFHWKETLTELRRKRRAFKGAGQ